jgi:hypothetical protein
MYKIGDDMEKIEKDKYESVVYLLNIMKQNYVAYFGEENKFVKKIDTEIPLLNKKIGKRKKIKYELDYSNCPKIIEAYSIEECLEILNRTLILRK